jgi:hypothetical protein
MSVSRNSVPGERRALEDARIEQRKRDERVLLRAIARATQAFVKHEPGATVEAMVKTVETWLAWQETGRRRLRR